MTKESERDWNPEARRVHCANCAWARVRPGADGAVARCVVGMSERELWVEQMVRAVRPVGFRRASECPMFRSMSEETRDERACA